LQIMAEDANGRFTIADCERLSKELSPVLDVEDPIDREYHLEASSPGIDRPLVQARDFVPYIGHDASLELAERAQGRRRFGGAIKGADADSATIALPDTPKDQESDHGVPLALLAEGKLVMADGLLDLARNDQQDRPIDDDGEIETIELPQDDTA